MSVDYADAAKRHWRDGTYLIADSRHAGADHLFGLAAECGLKAIMAALAPQITGPSGDIQPRIRREKNYRHINELWIEFTSFIQGRAFAKYFLLLAPGTPFSDWNIDQRYHHSGSISEDAVRRHEQSCHSIMKVLQEAQNDGVI